MLINATPATKYYHSRNFNYEYVLLRQCVEFWCQNAWNISYKIWAINKGSLERANWTNYHASPAWPSLFIANDELNIESVIQAARESVRTQWFPLRYQSLEAKMDKEINRSFNFFFKFTKNPNATYKIGKYHEAILR